jgi:hypothetical protein
VIFIDVPGLDDGRTENQDEVIRTNIMKQITGVQNICCVLLIIKRGEIMGASIKKVMVDYKKLLNCKKEKE